MALLTATSPTNNGTTTTPAAVAVSDTISSASMSSKGCILKVINGGGSSDTVAITDASLTPAGSVATNPGSAVANGTSKTFWIRPEQVNQSTGLVTVTHSFTTSVTYELWTVPV